MNTVRNATSIADAAASYVGRAVADMERLARQEREIREAQFAAKMAELETRIAAVSEIESRMADRLATLKDGESGRDGSDGADGQDGRDGADAVAPTAEAIALLIVDDAKAVATETARAIVEAWDRPIDGRDGADADPEVIRGMVAEAVSAIPAPRDGQDGKDGENGSDGKDADPDVIRSMVDEAVAAIPVPKDGKDGVDGKDGRSIDSVDVDIVDRETIVLRLTVGDIEHAFEIGLPEGPAGKDADPEQIAEMVAEHVSTAMDSLPAPEKGDTGPMGALPIVKAWEDRVYYQGEVCTFDGGTYQAATDTGKAPPHGDWTCIVSRGADGQDGRSFTVRGTFAEDGEYDAFDVVALNGAAFVAKHDNPGNCPGEGWQMIAMQGKTGKPGPKGDTGMGVRGLTGPAVSELTISDDGMLSVHNADGSTAAVDLYPLLSKIGG